MRQATFNEFGSPPDVVQVVEADARAPQSTEVRVRLNASPINPSDLLYIEGRYGIRPELPAQPGFEAVGVIDAAGEKAGIAVGQRVALLTFGCWSEQICVPARMVRPVPDEMDDTTACSLLVNPLTALALLDELGLAEGQWLVQTAGASALGRIVQATARKRGIKLISTVRRSEQATQLRESGCDVVVNTKEDSLTKVVAEVTGGQGVPAVLDAVGGRLGSEAIVSLAQGGTAIVYGLLSMRPTMVSNGDMTFRQLTVKGFWLTNWLQTTAPERIQEAFAQVVEGFQSGLYTQEVDSTYPLNDVREALAHAAGSGRHGKTILMF
jgi:NADPH:quinone reductase-like Zn-dependent oxidoreductase